jgi:hypothetical protein
MMVLLSSSTLLHTNMTIYWLHVETSFRLLEPERKCWIFMGAEDDVCYREFFPGPISIYFRYLSNIYSIYSAWYVCLLAAKVMKFWA